MDTVVVSVATIHHFADTLFLTRSVTVALHVIRLAAVVVTLSVDTDRIFVRATLVCVPKLRLSNQSLVYLLYCVLSTIRTIDKRTTHRKPALMMTTIATAAVHRVL